MSATDQPRAFDAMLNDLATMPLMDAGMMGGFYAELRADLVLADITDDELADMTARIIGALRRGGQGASLRAAQSRREARRMEAALRETSTVGSDDGDHSVCHAAGGGDGGAGGGKALEKRGHRVFWE